jgi:hypothetical protein
VTSLLIALLICGVVSISIVVTRRNVSPVLSVALVFAFVLWYVTPVVTTLGAPERRDSHFVVSPDVFVKYAVLETAAFLATVLLFLLGGRSLRVIERGRLAHATVSRRVLWAVVGLGVLAHIWVRWRIVGVTGTAYDGFNALNVVAAGSDSAAELAPLVFADSLLQAISAACAFTTVRGAPFLRTATWLWISGATLSHVMVGARLALLIPCVLVLMALHERGPSRAVMATVYGSVLVFVSTFGVLLTIVIPEIRGESSITLSEVNRQSRVIITQAPSRMRELFWDFFDHLNIKFDSISAGARLVDEFGPAAAGWRAYEGALLAVVPRSVLPFKPVPGSMDGTTRGTPSRLVAATLRYDAETGNVGVGPAAISIWQFGAVGLVLLVAVNTMNLRLINALLRPRSLMTRSLAMFLIGVPFFLGVFGPGDFQIMNIERVLVLYVAGTILLHSGALLRMVAVASAAKNGGAVAKNSRPGDSARLRP